MSHPVFDIGGKVALVTGSSRGIGRAIALNLADAGYDIVVHCRSRREEAEAVVAEIVAGFDAQALKVMASAVAAAGHTIVAIVAAGNPALVVIARSPDTAGDAGALLRKVIEQFGGKGGGKPDLAQGNLNGEPAAVLDALRTLIA